MKLAIFNGEKIRNKPFPKQITIGEEEKQAVQRVWDSATLSAYRGNWSKNFWGGEEIQKLEKEFAEKIGAAYAIACNSCTSALIIACGAAGVVPGEEVIVTPWSMTCSASAPLHWGATPVFADVEYDHYCLDITSIENKITDKTTAIIVVDLFGQPADYEKLRALAHKHNLTIIEDAAQAPGATHKNISTGILGDMGCFSFTQGKHLTAGEGGMITTNSAVLAMKCRLIMNHAESVINDMNLQNNEMSLIFSSAPNMVGYNMRMTEIQAAILREQIKKLDDFIEIRQENVRVLNEGLRHMPCIEIRDIRPNCTHSFYVQPFRFNSEKCEGIHRDTFIDAVIAELSGEEGRADRPMLGKGYIKPLYQMPLFKHGFHPALRKEDGFEQQVNLPVVEALHKDKFFLSMYHNLPLSTQDICDITNAFCKVWENKGELHARTTKL